MMFCVGLVQIVSAFAAVLGTLAAVMTADITMSASSLARHSPPLGRITIFCSSRGKFSGMRDALVILAIMRFA